MYSLQDPIKLMGTGSSARGNPCTTHPHMRARARIVVQLLPDRYIADKGTVAVDENVLPKDYHLVCDLTFDVSGVSVSSIYPDTNRSVCLPQLLGLATETSGRTMEA